MLRPWESYRKKRHAGLIEKTSCNPSCSSFSNSGETSMPRKRKMRGTARAAQERDPPVFSCNFSGAGTGKARLDGKRSFNPEEQGKPEGERINSLPPVKRSRNKHACLQAGVAPLNGIHGQEGGNFIAALPFFSFPSFLRRSSDDAKPPAPGGRAHTQWAVASIRK